ncbi:hypothetical protein REPUB_Repub06bG0130300 [Reevesia pubescens]
MKISSINLTSFYALILFHILILMCSSLCLCHGEVHPAGYQRNQISRKLLSSDHVASFPTAQNNKLNGIMKEHKKAVVQSLRKAPTSVSNPTQN